MILPLFPFVRQTIDALSQAVKQRLRQWTKPHNRALLPNAAMDLTTRSKWELVLENALLASATDRPATANQATNSHLA